MTAPERAGLTPKELGRQVAEALPEREEMALISPRPPFPGLPDDAAEAASAVVPSYSVADEDPQVP